MDRVHDMLNLVDSLAALGDAECKRDIHCHDRAVVALELTTECRMEDWHAVLAGGVVDGVCRVVDCVCPLGILDHRERGEVADGLEEAPPFAKALSGGDSAILALGLVRMLELDEASPHGVGLIRGQALRNELKTELEISCE